MRVCLAAMFLAGVMGLPSPATAQQQETLLLQQPTISKTHIVFVYAGDLWVVGRKGGDARRLTSSPGMEGAPQLSPNGRWVAFSGEYEGNTDVYVISIDGGAPKRLTWHPSFDIVRDWHPDGKRILFLSGRASGTRAAQLFTVGVGGGMPEQLKIPRASRARYHKSGRRIAYTPVFDAFRSWKRYRGGRTTPIWIYDVDTYEVEQVPHVNASDSFPSWSGDMLYFASDRDNRMNLWRYDPATKDLDQLTHFKNFDVRSVDACEDAVVIEQAGALHVMSTAHGSNAEGGGFQRLKIRVRADGLAALPRWQPVKGNVRDAALAPNGKRVVFEARGEMISMPREHGDPRNLTSSPGVNERSPAWSPLGDKVAWFSDEGGEYRLVVEDHRGRGEPKFYDLDPDGATGQVGGFYYSPSFSPDGKHVLFRDKFNRIAFVTLETGKVTDVARSEGSLGVLRSAATWSPDSKWICYEKRNPRTVYDRLYLYELSTGKHSKVTDDFAETGSPAFSRDGKYLYFTASVDSGPQSFGLDMSASAARSARNSLYVCVLKKDGPHPLAPRSDEGFTKKKKDTDESKKPAKKPAEKTGDEPAEKPAEKAPAKPEAPSIDVDGLDQRVLSLPLPAGRYYGLACTDKALLYLSFPTSGQPSLMSWDFDKRKSSTLAPGVGGFQISADGKTLLMSSRSGYAFSGLSGKDKKPIPIDNVKVRVDPKEEWPQMLREVWRIQRDYFYDKNMHGVDWPAMWERWSPFVPYVKHRSDLNLLIAELIGELCCGHEYVSGGENPKKPEGVSVGLLGVDWDRASGRYRIAKIYHGQNWNPGLRSPLTEPGVDANEGDYLISVNGRPVAATENVFAAFENTAGKQVELELSAKADGSDARTTVVVPIASESSLRQRSWVEDNRKRVAKRSGGRIAYIYMPDTGNRGMAAFDRDFYSQLDKDALIIDERYNGGGKVADYVIETLSRDVMCYWMNREEWLGKTPFGTFTGPKVMVVNEMAGSGGDAMPWLFQQAKLGPLVGARTWGGLVGISGYPPLMDGGRVTAASFGVMDKNGNWAVENVGVTPDVEVVQWPKPIIEGKDPQLDKAIDLCLEQLEGRKTTLPKYKKPAKR